MSGEVEWKDHKGSDLKRGGTAAVIRDCFNRNNEKIAQAGDKLTEIDRPGPDVSAIVAGDGKRYFDLTEGYNARTHTRQVLRNSQIEAL